MPLKKTVNSSENDNLETSHYVLLGFLTLLNIINMVDRQLLTSFANYVVPDLGLSNAQFGMLTGIIFMVFYAVMGLLMGALADIYHRPRLISAALFMWSLLTAVSGAAKGFISLAIPRMLIGVGESALTPASMSMLADKFPVAKRAFAAGFYYTGVPIGFGISLLIAGYLGPVIGWRICFYLLGIIGIVLSVIVLFIADVPRRESYAGQHPSRQTIKSKISELWRVLQLSPALRLTIAGGVGAHFIFGAFTFDQLWYVQERGFDRAFIAQATGWIGVIGGVMGNLYGGIGSDFWRRRYNRSRISFLFYTMLLLAPINIYYRIAEPESFFFWLGIFFTFFQLGVIYGPILSTIQELAPPHICSTAVAFHIAMCSIVGVGVSATISGLLIDYFIKIEIMEAYTLSLLIFTVLSMSSIPAFYFASKHYNKRDHF